MDPNAFDTLMKRHAEGDRDPDLISELDRMAWSAFHDPWELSGPRPSAAPVPERMLLESGHYDPEQPEKLELATLDLFVSLRGRSFLKRTAWPFLVTYDYLADPEPSSCARIQLKRPDALHFYCRLLRNLDCDESDIPKILALCKRWNESRPWPEAMPLTSAAADPRKIIALEWEIKLPPERPSITLTLFSRVMLELQKASSEFWEQVQAELES